MDGVNRTVQGETGLAALQLLPTALSYVAGLKEEQRRSVREEEKEPTLTGHVAQLLSP